MTWSPISLVDMQYLMACELERLDDAAFRWWEKFGVTLEPITCERRDISGASPDRELIYVLARAGLEVLIYDDVEEEFGTGRVDPDGVLRTWGTWGDRLATALRHFPANAALPESPA